MGDSRHHFVVAKRFATRSKNDSEPGRSYLYHRAAAKHKAIALRKVQHELTTADVKDVIIQRLYGNGEPIEWGPGCKTASLRRRKRRRGE